jgi:tryptophan synthase alpha chain
MLKDHCDGVVIGSALVQKIEQLVYKLQREETRTNALNEFRSYAQSLVAPLG